MRCSDQAWLTLGASILAYEVLAPSDELLSFGADRYLQSHPVLTRAVILITALHLANWMPARLDPWHGFGLAVLHGKRHVTR